MIRRLGSCLRFFGTCVLIAVLWLFLWAYERFYPENDRSFLP